MPTTKQDQEVLLMPGEVADLARVDPKTVARWAKQGKIRAIRTLGGHRRYRLADVLSVMDLPADIINKLDTLMTPAEVAKIFRVDPKTVTRWAQAGKIDSLRTIGRHRRYRESQVNQYLRGAA